MDTKIDEKEVLKQYRLEVERQQMDYYYQEIQESSDCE